MDGMDGIRFYPLEACEAYDSKCHSPLAFMQGLKKVADAARCALRQVLVVSLSSLCRHGELEKIRYGAEERRKEMEAKRSGY